jgi:hypothetical protein
VAARLHNCHTVGEGDGAPDALAGKYQLIRRHAHDQPLAKRARRPQEIQVPYMEEVERSGCVAQLHRCASKPAAESMDLTPINASVRAKCNSEVVPAPILGKDSRAKRLTVAKS